VGYFGSARLTCFMVWETGNAQYAQRTISASAAVTATTRRSITAACRGVAASVISRSASLPLQTPPGPDDAESREMQDTGAVPAATNKTAAPRHPESAGHLCGGSSWARAFLINSSRCSGSVGEGSKSKWA